jgi:uncharacterized coiled-coil DUF342 family protein
MTYRIVILGMMFLSSPLLAEDAVELNFDRDALVSDVDSSLKALDKLSNELDATITVLSVLNLGLIITNYENNQHVCAALTELTNALNSMKKAIPGIRTKVMKAKLKVKNAKSVDDLLEAYETLSEVESEISGLGEALNLDKETLKALGTGSGAITGLKEVVNSASKAIEKPIGSLSEAMGE